MNLRFNLGIQLYNFVNKINICVHYIHVSESQLYLDPKFDSVKFSRVINKYIKTQVM